MRIADGIRYQLDPEYGRLWVLKEDAVYVYHAHNGTLVKRVELPGWLNIARPFNCDPDLLRIKSGALLVSSNVLPYLWEVDRDSFSVRRYELRLDTDHGRDVGFTALAFVDDVLIGVSAQYGSMWRIDLGARTATKIALSEPIYGACVARPTRQ